MATDIGEILFVQLLGMQQYPGSPFTGNLFRDLITFLVVPTIFIVIIVYTMSGRIFSWQQARLRILLAVGAYLFIIASGYYSFFALLAGPYFIFLIFIMGVLYFFMEHFKGKRPSGKVAAAGATHGFPMHGGHSGSGVATENPKWEELHEEAEDLEVRVEDLKVKTKHAPSAEERRAWGEQLSIAYLQLRSVRDKMKRYE